MTTLHLKKSMGRSPLRLGFLLIPLVVACFALLPRVQGETQAETISPAVFAQLPGFNTAAGFNVLSSNTTGIFNSGFGALALDDNTSGSHNTALGAQALANNLNGSNNTAVGENALVFNTAGSNNMGLGQGSLAQNLTGSNNTAMGFQALNRNTDNNNTGVGFQALFSNTGSPNTAVGFQALVSNTVGDSNNAVGFQALLSNTDGVWNNAVGYQALGGVTSGSENTAIGDSAGLNVTTGDGNIYIGTGAGGAANENAMIRIGNPAFSIQYDTFVAGIYGRPVGPAPLPVVCASNGKLTANASSRRFKHDIKPIDKASEAVLALKPVTFAYNNDTTNSLDFGLIAEEVDEVSPELVIRDAEGKPLSVHYQGVTMMVLNEFIKEHKTVEQLKSTVAKQEAIIAQQQKGMEVLTAQLKEQAAQIQKVSAELKVSKPAPQTAVNNQ